MFRSFILGVSLALALASCGGSDDSSVDTTEAPQQDATSEAETPAETTAVVSVDSASFDCAEMWPEASVDAAAGMDLAFLDTLSSSFNCVYDEGNFTIRTFFLGAGPDAENYTVGKDRAKDIVELDLCDDAYAVSVIENWHTAIGLDRASNTVFSVGVENFENSLDIATQLLGEAC